MDKWTLVGVVVTAIGAAVAFWLIKNLLTLIIDNWLWVLLGILAVFAVGLVAANRGADASKHDI